VHSCYSKYIPILISAILSNVFIILLNGRAKIKNHSIGGRQPMQEKEKA
jgi:hypothetical protein